ncbi:MAG: dUTPase [Clostridiales bacterium]|nr:dUTPase [Clostridiales bacterium]
MDKLDAIFEKQKALDAFISDARHLENGAENGISSEWMQRKAIALLVELTEVLNEVNYKWWKNPKEIDANAVKEELVDVLHFFVSMCLSAGLTADELFARYAEKNKENVARQNGTSAKKGYAISDENK